jgi:hypothetical protein
MANAVMMEGVDHGHMEGKIEHGTKDLENPCEHPGMQGSSEEGWILSDLDDSDKEDCINHDTMINCSACTSITPELDADLHFIGEPLPSFAIDLTNSYSTSLSELYRPPKD